ncbi:MAG TPA: hypothetical protein VK087_03125 [Tissierellaceae bacterium]|nr:hypothetical protein [Tissierellaceae bacterium]
MKNKKIFTGVLFIIAGIGLVVDKLGYLPDISIFSFLASIYLLYFIIKSIRRRNIFGILIPLSLIGVIYWDYIGLNSLNPWTLVWSSILISIGVSIIFKPKNKFKVYKGFKYKNDSFNKDSNFYENVDGNIYIESTFSESIRYLRDEDIKNVKLESTFGSMKIYFDDVKPLEDYLTVDIEATFSGVELYIPKEWKVINNVDVTFGGVKENNKNTDEQIYKLILNGESTFSGVNIIYI